MEGHPPTDIAFLANEKKYPTPLVYQRSRKKWNLAEPVTVESERLWDNCKVISILKRIEYTGTLVMGRNRSLTVGAKTTRARPRNEWTIVEEVNEPIVSAEEYEKANMVIRQAKKREYFISQNYPLKGKVCCGNCRQCLAYNVTTYKEYFLCNHGRQVKKYSKCCKDEYPVREIENIVWRALANMLSTLKELGVRIETKTKQQIQTLKKSRTEIEKNTSSLKSERIRQYEMYAEGAISKERYIVKRQELGNQIEEQEIRLSELTKGMNAEKELLDNSISTNSLVERFSGVNKLDRAIVNAFIEIVYIYDAKRVDVVFVHGDMLKQFEDYLNNPSTDT